MAFVRVRTGVCAQMRSVALAAAAAVFLTAPCGAGEGGNQRLSQKLNTPMTVEFEATSMEDVVRHLRDYTGVDIMFRKGDGDLRDVSLAVAKMRMRFVLDHLTDQIGMAWRARDGAIYIGPPEMLRGRTARFPVPLEALLSSDDDEEMELVRDMLLSVVPDLRKSGEVDLDTGKKRLVVVGTAEDKNALEQVYNGLRSALKQRKSMLSGVDKKTGALRPVSLSISESGDDAWKRGIMEALKAPVRFEVEGIPLRELASLFRKRLDVNILIDPEVDAEQEVTLALNDMKAGKALDWIARLTNLSWTLRAGAVVFERPGEADASSTALHFVGDVVALAARRTKVDPDRMIDQVLERFPENIPARYWQGFVVVSGSASIQDQTARYIGNLRRNVAR